MLAKNDAPPRTSPRRDPRVEPEPELEPEPVPNTVGKPAAVREEVAPCVKFDPRAEPEAPPDDDDEEEAPSTAPSRTGPPAVSVDARLAELEPLFGRSGWREIVDKLGPSEQAGDLPPALGLIHALARREAGGEAGAGGATELAIKSMAALLGVAPDSSTALVLAKRLLRQNPASWSTRPAPPAKLSAAIIVFGVAIGVAAGSFLSLETFHSLHLF